MGRTIIHTAIVLAIGLAMPVGAELVGYWKLNDGAGTEFWDETDYWHDGTISPVNENQVRWTTEAYEGSALEFLTPGGPFTLCDVTMTPGLLDVEEASYSFWMNVPTVFQAWGIVFVLIGQADDHSFEPDGAADFFVGRPIWFGTSGAKLNDNQWHHIAVTYSSSADNISIYIDGEVAASSAGGLSDPISTVRIGGPRSDGRAQWRRFIGRLDEVAVWNHGLNADDVRNVFWFGPQWARYATNPEPADEATVGTANVTLRWAAGETAAQHHVYVGESLEDVKNGTGDTDQGTTTEPAFSDYPWELGKTYYWRVDEVEADGETVYTGAAWRFTVSAKLASKPVPADGAVLLDPNDVTLSWLPGSGAVSHGVYLGTDPENLPLAADGLTETTYDPGRLEFGTVYHWRVDESDGLDTYTGDLWTFKTTYDIPRTDPNLVGFWNFDRDENAIAVDRSGNSNHGEMSGDPNHVAGYNLSALAFDGVNDYVDVPQVVGDTFTLMAWIKTDVPAPEGTTAREGSGLLWSDHAGGGDHYTLAVLGTKLAFETGPGGNPNTTSRMDVVNGRWTHVAVTRANDTGDIEIFIDGVLDAAASHSGNAGVNVAANPRIVIGANTLDSRFYAGLIDEVRAWNKVLTQEVIVTHMRGNLMLAWNPSPAMGEVVDIRHGEPLGWSPGADAAEHDVYLGTDEAAVRAATPETSGIYKGRRAEATHALAEPLPWDTICYWRVDEINTDGTIIPGNVWSFTVADYLIVDGFESYTDDDGNRIYQTWIDGFESTENGSQVGYNQEPFAERMIVHRGRQSMPLRYTNTGLAVYSEAERRWPMPEDWTVHGLSTLTLYLRGAAENSPMPLYVTIKDEDDRSATVRNTDSNVALATEWQRWPIPFSALAPVDMTQVKTMVIGLGDRANPTSGIGVIYIDDIEIHAPE